MPRHLHVPVGVTGTEQPDELVVAAVVEAFVGLGQQPAGPIQRVIRRFGNGRGLRVLGR